MGVAVRVWGDSVDRALQAAGAHSQHTDMATAVIVTPSGNTSTLMELVLTLSRYQLVSLKRSKKNDTSL